MNFSILKLDNNNKRKINIPFIIQDDLFNFWAEKKKWLITIFFYNGYKENTSLSLTQFIKYNFSNSLASNGTDYSKRNNIIKEF